MILETAFFLNFDLKAEITKDLNKEKYKLVEDKFVQAEKERDIETERLFLELFKVLEKEQREFIPTFNK